MRIESIANHLDLVETIGRWHWAEWGHVDLQGSLESWTDGLRQRTLRDRIPTTYVALADGGLLGSVTLVENDMDTRPDFSPWLAGLFVPPEFRRRGVGTALVEHAVGATTQIGVPTLYLYTADAQAFYAGLGWTRIAEDFYEGSQVVVMTRSTATFYEGESVKPSSDDAGGE